MKSNIIVDAGPMGFPNDVTMSQRPWPSPQKTHEDIKNKGKTSWRYTTQRNLDTPIKTKAYIQHTFKENSKVCENNSKRFTLMIQAKYSK
jgi:hypothetical protein